MSIAETRSAAGGGLNSEFRRGVASCAPVLFGTIPYALVLGAQATQRGLSTAELSLLTGLNFAGGSEFAAIQLWTSPPHVLLIIAITFLVNSRHLLMGAALAPFLRDLPRRKVFSALFFMCDESWALGLADARRRAADGVAPAFSPRYYMGAAVAMYLTWVAFTTIGALLGPVLGEAETYGFDMAFAAVFLVLLRGMWKDVAAARPWLVSLIIAALTYLFVPGAWYVAAGALAGLVSAWLLWRDEA
ncbi:MULTISPECIES: AzlC family ABC transporter permease [unclassified Mesorhizobium]|uniref:AzlC family ABC transporter permease n=1 Tax=unclassified Mesorhizobium TaxID=325217 RepID=UPI00112DE34C|nr:MULTISPECIES: AzlC family ABC transporter permease [unclassified Mesorhizobium]MCA0027578.1 AzlC family ABC transporter permease [Mesorhizobium sp. B263B1A]TPJ94067.1 AzlC family ABC transporter permease [Mesorhizobium sp. B2-5-12]TPK25915.1 AzlC family ABC transporter permease [Mesorhizobium sp. B2-5-6]TPM01219.1 AzlC family ABC transporter permease [Mesorhizobium sp. B2-3-8]TPM14432.1 AzlC family ABC transporter permease [Mesorhizobium sp. B2-3-7]